MIWMFDHGESYEIVYKKYIYQKNDLVVNELKKFNIIRDIKLKNYIFRSQISTIYKINQCTMNNCSNSYYYYGLGAISNNVPIFFQCIQYVLGYTIIKLLFSKFLLFVHYFNQTIEIIVHQAFYMRIIILSHIFFTITQFK